MTKRPSRLDKLNASIDANRASSKLTPKAKPNARRSGKGFALDVTGSACLSDGRWSPNGGGTLAVTFVKGGDQYLYFGVERSTAKQVQSGEDFNELIKGSYPYE
jgi:hypothetical protein